MNHKALTQHMIDTGLVPPDTCIHCGGHGKRPCPYLCHGFGRCPKCSDTGFTDNICWPCKGTGKIAVAAEEG